MVGAVLQAAAVASLAAQVPQRDTTRRDTVRVGPDTIVVPIPPQEDAPIRDSLPDVAALDTLRDTLQAPIARAEMPRSLEIGESYRWSRDALFASGALSLAELLARIPGFTSFTTGWISTPSVGAYIGDAARVRVFRDGVAVETLDPRDGGVLDLSDIQLWTLEEVLVERGATEIRVHLRSWRVRHIVPSTRTDVGTGDQRTNTFRGFYGKRWRNGAALQVAAQQWGSDAEYNWGADGDELSLFLRTGWARGRWSADASLLTARRTRSDQPSYGGFDPLPGLDRTRALAYARLGWGDPEDGPWAQLLASTQRVSSEHADEEETRELSRNQYVAAAGVTRLGVRLSGTARLHAGDEASALGGVARLAWDGRFAGLSAYVERDAVDSVDRAELAARVTPFSWLSLAAAAGRTIEDRSIFAPVPRGIADALDDGPLIVTQHEVDYARAEAGVRLGDAWLGGGMLARSESRLAGLAIVDDDYLAVDDPEALGAFLTARGRVWRDVHLDAMVTVWDSASFYRPRWQTRTTVVLLTNWLSRFPSGDFHLRLGLTHEYRSDAPFPTSEGVRVAPAVYEGGRIVNNTISTQLEIRIADAVLYWQLRNVTGLYTEEVPGFLRPRQTNLYGVRWEFSN